jgi:AcrR family transcriptional regulator
MVSDSRERMVRSAASLISARGVSATSFSEVLSDSGAPRGSIYHHFPDGKRQLAEAAIALTSERVLAAQGRCAGTTPSQVLECFIDLWRRVVSASGATAGCAVAGVAVDTDTRPPAGSGSGSGSGATPDHDTATGPAGPPPLMTLVRDTFRSWTDLLAAQLEAVGVPAARAGSIAVATLAGMEGALILCRAEGDGAPLEAVASELLRLVRDDPAIAGT